MLGNVPYAKYHAAGNDFIVVAAADLGYDRRGGAARATELASLARAILGRHTGVGADGLLVMWPPADPNHHAAVQIFNADGSEAEMSGNGIRCAALWLLDQARFRVAGRPDFEWLPEIISLLEGIEIETPVGVKAVKSVDGKGGETCFRVAMGEPVLEPVRIPFGGPGALPPVVRYILPTSLGSKEVTVLSMGNPHCTLFVNQFNDFDWCALGREIERHPLFPNRTNVEFVRVLSPSEIEVRFWERGVGETASSGTGSSAAAVAASLNGLATRRVRVKTPGGGLEVNWAKSNQVSLTGPVRRIARGTFEYDQRADAKAARTGASNA